MKKRIILTLLTALIYHGANSQSCDCKTNFDSLVTKVEESYSGYFDKASGKNSLKYNQFKDNLSLKAESATYYTCYLLLREYLSFFKDPHLYLFLGNIPPKDKFEDTLRSMFSALRKIPVDTNELRQYYQKGPKDEIEGIWNALSFDFRIAIRKVSKGGDNKYEAIALKTDNIKWFSGQIKMNIEKAGKLYLVEYFKNDHLPDTILGCLNHGKFDLGGNYGKWEKLYPASVEDISGTVPSNTEPPISFRKVSEDVCILKIQDFWVTNKPLVDSIVGANLSTIKETPYLIIDIRNNGGGHTMTYDTILPLIYTKPFKRDGFVVRSSKDNISLYKETLDDPKYVGVAASFKNIIQKMEDNIGQMVVISTPDSFSYERVMPFPKKVAVIVNKKTGSAAEMFVQYAKQSDKVIIVGTNTKGALDYTEIARPRDLPCPYLKFYCPMGTGNHIVFPLIDNIGISPDIKWSGENIDNKFSMEIMNK